MKLRHLAAIGLAGTLGLAACGSSSDDSGTAGTTAAPSPETDAPAATDAAAGTTIRLWLNGEDTPHEFVEYASPSSRRSIPMSKVTFERQQWTGIVEKLTTALSSSDSPDVVELGNTQAQAFEAAGALADLTDKKADARRRRPAAEPGRGRHVRRQVLRRALLRRRPRRPVPQGPVRGVRARRCRRRSTRSSTPANKLKADNAATPNFSGMYFPGKNWYAALPFIWADGGDIAVQEGDDVEGHAGVDRVGQGPRRRVKKIMDRGVSGAPKDGDEAKDYIAFCNGEVGMMHGPGLEARPDHQRGRRLPRHGGQHRRLRTARHRRRHDGARRSSVARTWPISANSENPELAYDLLKILVGEGYQSSSPGRHDPCAEVAARIGVERRRGREAQAKAAANSRFVPVQRELGRASRPATSCPTCWCRIAQGGDVRPRPPRPTQAIEAMLNG